MKIIKSFLLVTVGICAATLLHAQELQTKVVNKTEAKTPPASNISSIPSPQPELKPMNGVELKQAPAKAAETESSVVKDKNNQKPHAPKPVAAVAVTDAAIEKPASLPVPGPVVIKEQ